MIAYATLGPDSPRYADWIEVFGTDRVRLRSARSHMAILPGIDGPRRCYRADLGAVTQGQRERLRRHVAERFCGHDMLAALRMINGRHGLPILDGPDLIVTVEAAAYL